jgi:hypothetical protein
MASSLGGSPSSLEESEKDKLLADIAEQFARKGQRSQALKVAETLVEPELKAKTIAAIALTVSSEQ